MTTNKLQNCSRHTAYPLGIILQHEDRAYYLSPTIHVCRTIFYNGQVSVNLDGTDMTGPKLTAFLSYRPISWPLLLYSIQLNRGLTVKEDGGTSLTSSSSSIMLTGLEQCL